MTRTTRAELLLLSCTAIWGSTFALGKIVLVQVTPLQMVFVRFGLATVIVTVFAWRSIFPVPWRAVARGTILGVFLFVGFITQTIGLTETTASKSAFITGLTVIFVPLLQFMMERRAPKIGNLVGVLVVSGGLWLLTSPEGSAFNAGDALTVVCAVVFGLYMVYLDIVSREMTTLQLTFLQLASNAGLALIGLLAFGSLSIVVSPSGAAVLLYLTLLSTVLTLFVQTRFQKDTSPVRAAIIFTVEPVFAAIFAYIVLDERLGSAGILGGAMIVAGVLLSELSDSIPLLNRSLESEATHPENVP